MLLERRAIFIKALCKSFLEFGYINAAGALGVQPAQKRPDFSARVWVFANVENLLPLTCPRFSPTGLVQLNQSGFTLQRPNSLAVFPFAFI